MDLINTKVKHNMLGVGTVTEFDGQYLTVEFAARTSRFIYPDAFEKFIKAEDMAVQEAIIADLVFAKQTKEERQQAELNAREVDESRKAVGRNIEKGFGPDYNVKYLARQPILTYQQVEEQFGIKISGFGRGINKTRSAVILISSVDKKKSGFVYHDHWNEDGDYIYSGEGKTGDQTMSFGNRAIVNAGVEGKSIHLFVKFTPQEYFYQGVFELVNHTYDNDVDENGNTRKEYKFRLCKVSRDENFD